MDESEPQQFDAILFDSQRGLRPIYIHRFRADPSKCFKFMHRREDRYKCYKCDQMCEKGSNLVSYSIQIKDGRFQSDPESMDHACVKADQLLNYNDVLAQQCYREGVKLAKREHFFPSIVDKYVRSLIEKRLGSEAAQTMQGLVDQRSRYSAYSRSVSMAKKRKLEKNKKEEDDDSDFDIEPEMLEELRRLNQETASKQKPKPVRPSGLPTIAVPTEPSQCPSTSNFEHSDRQITLNDLINVVDEEEKLPASSNDQSNLSGMEQNEENVERIEDTTPTNSETTQYIGEFGYSKSNKHPILIYRSQRDPTKCFTFVRRRSHARGGSYTCLQCGTIRKGEGNGKIILDSIGVEGNRFVSDPEAIYHYCIAAGIVQSYTEVTVRQIQRAALILAEEENLSPYVIDQLLISELRATFGEDLTDVLCHLPDRPARIKSYTVRRTVHNPQEKKPARRPKDSGFLYEATYGLSKDGSHPLLIIRRTDDSSKAFTFMHKRDRFYQCSSCIEAYKTSAGQYSTPPTIRATDNYFHTDPEKYQHVCLQAGLEQPYAKVVAVQCYREGLRMAESGDLNSETLDSMVCDQIRHNFPDDASSAISFLPPKKSRLHAYRKRVATGEQKRQILNRMQEEGNGEQEAEQAEVDQPPTPSLNDFLESI